MLFLLPFAAEYARPELSNFRVGEVGKGLSGNLYFGFNIEFAGQALSFTVHGEQCTLINAWMSGEEGLESLAIPAPACGYCRQFLQELVTAPTLRILLPENTSGTLSDLLPAAFSPQALGMERGLMHRQHHSLTLQTHSEDPLEHAALATANISYSPYTNSYSGVALRCKDGTVVSGPYAESVAFNPSMSPAQAAICMLILNGRTLDMVAEAVLVELPRSKVSQILATRATLTTQNSEIPLRVSFAEVV